MNNLLYRFNAKTIRLFIAITLFVYPFYATIRYGIDFVFIGLFVVTSLLLFMQYKINEYKKDVEQSLKRVTENMVKGQLDDRIFPINTEVKTGLNEVAFSVNDTLNQMETFIREVSTVFEFIWAGKFYRGTFPVGLHGIFAKILADIDQTVKEMESGYWQKEKSKLLFELDSLRNIQLLKNLKKNQSDLSSMASEMTKVEIASMESAETAQQSEQTVKQVLENISQLTKSIRAM